MALFVDIEKTLGSFHLRVKFEAENNVLALLGASGCGKSMTLKCIAGIETPDRGRIVLDGVTLFDSEARVNLAPQKRRVGYLFQQYALFPNMTVAQNIACGVREKKEVRARVAEMIEAMHLQGMEHKKPHQLSGGQQQRAALARILVNAPEVLLLDEPFSALDSHLRFQLESEVRSAIRRFGKTVLLVSHNRDEVFRLSDAIAIMNSGAIETIGDRKSVFADPGTVNGAILTGCKNVARLEKRGERLAHIPDWGVTLETDRDIGDSTHLGVRMHDVLAGDQAGNALRCEVVEEIENPFSYTVMLRPQGAPQAKPIGWELDKNAWSRRRADTVTVCLPPEHLLLLRE
ncbi:MAG: sulfate/molybdate ABC transporter ATP-binding protein [Candidatus Ventricola sp.]